MASINIPKKWNTWKVIDLIGEGSSSVVYHVRDRISGRDAAVKIITIEKTPLSEEEFIAKVGLENVVQTMDSMDETFFEKKIEKARKEIDILNQLKDHENIVGIYDYEIVIEENLATIYILMEYLQDLWTWFDLHPMTEDSVIELGIQICKALEFCEGNNIFHQDIKPENILVSKAGIYKLTDFSVSDIKDGKNVTSLQQGTMLYMAPESIIDARYNKRSEVYALGLILYQLSNRKCLPFMDQNKGIFVNEDFHNTIKLRCQGLKFEKPSDVTENLGQVLLKACAFNEADRYPSVVEFGEELENIATKPNIIAETMPDYGNTEEKICKEAANNDIDTGKVKEKGTAAKQGAAKNKKKDSEKRKKKVKSTKKSKSSKIVVFGIATVVIAGVAGGSLFLHNTQKRTVENEVVVAEEATKSDELQTESVEQPAIIPDSTLTVSESIEPEEEFLENDSPSSHVFEMKDLYQIGDYIFDQDCKITYVSAEVYECPDPVFQPSDGYRYIAFNLLLENLSQTETHYSSLLDYECLADGISCDRFMDTIDSATLTPGRYFHVKLIYEVPDESNTLILQYCPKHNIYMSDINFVYEESGEFDFVEEEHRISTEDATPIGTEIILDECVITVKEFDPNASLETTGLDFKPNHHQVSVTYYYKNTSHESSFIDYTNFALFADGYFCDYDFHNSESGLEIAAGTGVELNVTYEVPDGASILEADFLSYEGWLKGNVYRCTFALPNNNS